MAQFLPQRIPLRADRVPRKDLSLRASVAEWRKRDTLLETALFPLSYRIQGMADPSNSISIDAFP
jgi:hypothetical protein